MISPKGNYVLLSYERGNDNDEKPRLIRLSDGTETTLPPGNNYTFSDSEEFILWSTGNDEHSQKAGEPFNIEVYSLAARRVVHEIKGIPGPEANWRPFYDISSDGDRLVVLIREGNRNVVAIYDVASGQKLAVLTGKDDDGSRFAVHTPTAQVCTLSYSPTKEVVIQLWNLRDGTFVRERRIATKDWTGEWIRFCKDGSHLIASSFGHSLAPVVLQVSDLQLAKGVSSKQMHEASARGEVLYWSNAGGVNIWEVGSHAPILVPKIKFGEKDRLVVSSNLQHAVIWREGGVVELRDLAATKRVSVLPHTGMLVTAYFTLDDAAVALIEEGGLCSLFDAQNGDGLAQRFAKDGNSSIGYDRDLRRFHLWNQSGQVLRFIEGRNYFGIFVPTRSGAEK